MHEIALEERKLKLEEDKLKFKCEKWQHEQQMRQQEHHQQVNPDMQEAQQHRARQYVSSDEDSALLQPMHFFAAEDNKPMFALAVNEHVLDPSEL